MSYFKARILAVSSQTNLMTVILSLYGSIFCLHIIYLKALGNSYGRGTNWKSDPSFEPSQS